MREIRGLSDYYTYRELEELPEDYYEHDDYDEVRDILEDRKRDKEEREDANN